MLINIDILSIEVIVCLIVDLIPVRGDWTRIRDYEYPDIPFLLTWKGHNSKRLDQPRRSHLISTTLRTAAAVAASGGDDYNNVDRMTKLRPWLSPKFNEAPYEENTSRASVVVAATSAKIKKKHKLNPKSNVFENKDELQSKEEAERFNMELNERNFGEGSIPGSYYEENKKNIPLNTEGYVTCQHPDPSTIEENVGAPVTEGEVNSAKSSRDPPSQDIENAIIKSKNNLNFMINEKPIDRGPSVDYALKTSEKNDALYSEPLTDERKYRNGYQDAPQGPNRQSERNSKQKEREYPDLKMYNHAKHEDQHRPLDEDLTLDYELGKSVGTLREVHRTQSQESGGSLAKTSLDEDPDGRQFKFGKNTRNIAETAGDIHKEYTAVVDMKNGANPSYRDENPLYYSNSADKDPEILVEDDLHRTNKKYNCKLYNEGNSYNRKENLQVAKTREMKKVSPEMFQNETQGTFLGNSGVPTLSQSGAFDVENKIDRYKPVKEVSYSLSGRYYANSGYNQSMSRDGTNWNPVDRVKGEVTSEQPMRGEPGNERPVVHDKYQLSQKKVMEGGGGGLLARPPIKAPPFVDRDPNSEKNPINTENMKKEKGQGKKTLLQGILGPGNRDIQTNPSGNFAQRISFEEIVQSRPQTGEYIQNQTQEIRYYMPQSPLQPYSNETSRNYLDPAVYLNTIENEQGKSREGSVLAENVRIEGKDSMIDKKPVAVERNENEMADRRQMVASHSYVYNNTADNEPFLGSNMGAGNFSMPCEYNQQSEQNLELGRNESEKINDEKLIYRTHVPMFQLPEAAAKDAPIHNATHLNYTKKMENEKLNEQQMIPASFKINQNRIKENTSSSKYLQNEMFKKQNNNINTNQPNKNNLFLNDPHLGSLDENTVKGLNKMDTSAEQLIPVNLKTNQNTINENTPSSKYLQNEMFKNQNNNINTNQPNKINSVLNDHHVETFNESTAKGLDKVDTNGSFLKKNFILSDSNKNVGNIPINRNKMFFEYVPNEKNVTNEYIRKDTLDENSQSKTYIASNYQINDKRVNESAINENFMQHVNKINVSDIIRPLSNGNNKGYNVTQSEHNEIRGAASNESYAPNGSNKTNYSKEDKTNENDSYDSEERESDLKDSEEVVGRDSEKADSRRENTEDSDISKEDNEDIRYENIEGSKRQEDNVLPKEHTADHDQRMASRLHKMAKKWVKRDDFADKNDGILHEGVHNEEMDPRSGYYSLSKTEEPSRISALLNKMKETGKQKKKYKHLKRDYDYKNIGKNANESGNPITYYYEDDYDDYDDLEDYRGGAASTALPAQRTQGQDKPRSAVSDLSATRASLQAHRKQTNSYRENGLDNARVDPFLHPIDINDPELELVISSNSDSNNKLHQLDSDDSDLPEKKTEVSFRMKLNDELSEQEMSLMRDRPVLSKSSSEVNKKHSRKSGNK